LVQVINYQFKNSVTPEIISKYVSERIGKRGIIFDPFCGCGGNAIQFALLNNEVIASDIDPIKIYCAKRNAKI
jgi:trimethylguanosine synthase